MGNIQTENCVIAGAFEASAIIRMAHAQRNVSH